MALKLLERPGEASDEELVLAVRRGDDRAIAQLYRRYARYVAALAFRMLGSEDEVDDIVQQVFFETVRSAERVEFVRSWLYRLTTRQVSRRLRKRWQRRRLETALGFLMPRRGDPEGARHLDELYEGLDGLSPDLRIPWCLHHVEGQTIPETAALCGVSAATVKRRIARADEVLAKRGTA